jgi:hypothetical protein
MTTQEAVMTTKEVANRLSELFKENKWNEALDELFSDDAESVEPAHSQGMQSVKGLDNIKKKGQQFNEMVEEMHGGYVSEPVVAGKFVAFGMGMDCTLKGMGRKTLEEIAIYEIKDGKIVKEEFIY